MPTQFLLAIISPAKHNACFLVSTSRFWLSERQQGLQILARLTSQETVVAGTSLFHDLGHVQRTWESEGALPVGFLLQQIFAEAQWDRAETTHPFSKLFTKQTKDRLDLASRTFVKGRRIVCHLANTSALEVH